jgi:hypothetical protein
MTVLENAKKHFADKVSGKLQKITVHEWKTDVYYKAVHSFATESHILELQQQGKIVEALVESIIQKALTIDGNKMFTKHDKLTLMNEVDPGVLTKIASAINSATLEIKPEEVVKN